MKRLAAALLITAAAVSPALADDVACDDATFLLDTVGDLLVDIEYVRAGVRGTEDITQGAESVAKYGDDALARTTDEGWPDAYLQTLGALIALGNDLVARGGALADGETATIRTHAAALRTESLARCDADDVPTFIEPGGLACPAVADYVFTLNKQLPALRGEGNRMLIMIVGNAARDAAESVAQAQWPAASVAAQAQALTAIDAIARGDAEAGADAAAEVVALTGTVVADARIICPTDVFPDLAAGT